MDFFEEQEPSFFRKHRVTIGCGVVVVVALAAWWGYRRSEQPRTRMENNFMMVNLAPVPLPPPPLAPPPPPPQEIKQEMITQETLTELDVKPEPTPTSAASALGLGTSLLGDGSADGFGLRANKNTGIGAGQATNRGTRSRWGWYAGQVQNIISQALQNNNSTKYADFRLESRIWVDSSGRITRAKIGSGTVNPALIHAITNEVLAGLILQDPPPSGMPMPIVLRITARPATMALSR